MKRISYLSTRSEFLSSKEIRAIEEISRKNNQARGITGFFVIIDNHFFQTIEGPAEAIDLLFDKIRQDPRHDQIICLTSEENVSTRKFPDWSMNWFATNHAFGVKNVFESILKSIIGLQNNLAQYTQIKILNYLSQGVLPSSVEPFRVEKTVLMSDIAGFTMLCENLESQKLVNLVNHFLEITCDQVNKHGGEINKIIGDCVLAVFDASNTDDAIQAAVSIVQNVTQLRQESQDSVCKFLQCGIGIDTGMVTEGNIGTAVKKDYTILGTAVNVASRLESLTRFFQKSIVISERTSSLMSDHWELEALGDFKIKGIDAKQYLYTLKNLQKFNVNSI